MNIEIVTADVSHISELKTYLSKGKDRSDEMVHEYVAEKFDEEALRRELDDPRVALEPPPDSVRVKSLVHMERLYVDQEFQGRGAGTALLRHCENFALQKGYKGLWLGVWDENQAA